MSSDLQRVLLGSWLAAVLTALLPTAAWAQFGATDVRPFPLVAGGVDAATGLPALLPDPSAVDGLTGLDRVVLRGLSMPGGAALDLELQRLALDGRDLGFHVNGQPAPALLDGLALSVWKGSVAGQPSSEAVLSFSRKGSHGWVRANGELLHLLPQPGDGGDWLAYRVLLARESDLAARGLSLGNFCGVPPPAQPIAVPPLPPGAPGDGGPDCTMRSCSMAIETDYQYFELFGDVGAETAYLTTLIAAVSEVFEAQVDTVLDVSYVGFYTTPADPWTTPDVFGDTLTMLYEFQEAWAGEAMPADAVLGHFLSGVSMGGGIAYLGVLNDVSRSFSFSVSADNHGQTPFPIAIDPLNWDFVVFAHETGHNFGAPHTHEMEPPVDTCGSTWDCAQGTIMSYCHAACGTMEATTPVFAPESAAVMLEHANFGLPPIGPMVVDPGTIPPYLSEENGILLSVDVTGVPVGPPLFNVHYAVNQPYQSTEMFSLGGNTWGTVLIAPLCGQPPEWFYSMVDQDCGSYATPEFTAGVGSPVVVVHHDFETGAGWTSGAPGDTATGGLWTRGDPVGTWSEPHAELTEGGTECWYTGQGVFGGEQDDADVDDGTTTLLSPVFDLSAGDARVGFWLWFATDEDDGSASDHLTVEITNSPTGTWVPLVTVNQAPGTIFPFWTYHEFQVSNFVLPGSQVRLRLVTADLAQPSVVEAAVDEFQIFRVACVTTCQETLGFAWPPNDLDSPGDAPQGASLTICGGDLSLGTHASLSLKSATPNGAATFFASLGFAPTPFKGGTLVPIPPTLMFTVPIGSGGAFHADVKGGHGPVSIYVQAAYQSPGTAPANVGLSNAVRVDLLP